MIWFTSDLHLGHHFVAGLRGFDDTDDHDNTLADNWDAVVKSNDEVHVLGDNAMRSPHYALAWLARRPGNKHLISGNHDGCHPMHRRWKQSMRDYLEVFRTVSSQGAIRLNGDTVLLSHFPYGDDHTDPPRYMEWRFRDEGRWLLHGHTHDKDQRVHGREIHVGVDAWGMTPVSESVITRLIKEEQA